VALRIGIDVGGTFTDLFLWSGEGDIQTFKVLTTPEDPSVGVVTGLTAMAESRGVDIDRFVSEIVCIVHGTTVTTNAVLTRGGARTALLTTEGVRDALEMRRGIREEQYNNRFQNVRPLVPRYLRLPVRGRLDYEGKEITPLDAAQVRAAARFIREEGIQAVAICFMNSFANPAQEQAARSIVQEELPDQYLSVSSEVLPTVRFYNRVSTTVLNAYVGPVLRDYLNNLTGKLDLMGFRGVLLIMQSNGGVALPDLTLRLPAMTLLSGPAAGPRAAVVFAQAQGRDDCILVDMGGTSFDASLVRDGHAATATEGEIDRLRIALPMLDITTIGAGGGSIGWIDKGGLLRMGPESAGAVPGPACYRRGGERPTCTDADLVLGYLDPEFFAGGKLPLDPERARRAVRDQIAQPLGMEVEEAAAGMYRVINANMAHGVRQITIRRGLDPREFPMVVAGGAGALHACMIAEELEIPTLLVPATASILCAMGMVFSDLQHDFVRSRIGPLSQILPSELKELIEDMALEGEKQLVLEGISRDQMAHQVTLDLRYLKQYHEVILPVSWDTAVRADIGAIAAAFHREHNRLYGYDLAGEGTELELINVRVRALGRTEKPNLPKVPEGTADPAGALKGRRLAFVPEEAAFAPVPVYDGHRLLAGNEIKGPALVERRDTTIFVSAGFAARVDDHATCILRRKGRDAGRQD
jgi:N-methylhydantoinase A